MRTHRSSSLLVAVVVAGLVAGCLPTEDWSQFGFNERHTGFPSQETTITSGNVGSLAVRWSVPFSDSDAPYVTPLVAGGRLFVFGATGTRAYDTTTRGLLWSSTASGRAAVVVNMNLHLFGTVESILDTSTGRVVKTYPVAASSAVAYSGVLYFVTNEKTLYRQAGTGTPTVLYSNPAVQFYGGFYGGNAVLFNGQLDVIGWVYGFSAVLSFNPTTGALNWLGLLPNTDYAEGGEDFVAGNISAGYGNLYVTALQGIEAISASTGKFLWKQDRILCETIGCWPDDLLLGRVAIADNRIFLNAYDGTFALNPATGAVLWHHSWSSTDEASPTVANGLVYALGRTAPNGTPTLVVLSETTGAVLKTIPGLRSFDPIVYGGQLFEQDNVQANVEVLGVG